MSIATFAFLWLCYVPSAMCKPEGSEEIRKWVLDKGYPFEAHNATTQDGVNLALFRVPRQGARVVFLQHGVLDSAWAWVFNTEFQALAFQIHDAGYDVWLGNNRGNSFSQRLADGSDASGSYDFWNFTFDSMARLDVPANLAKVVEVTGQQQVAYLAHSQGTTQFLIAASDPELQETVSKRVAVFIALSPIAWVGNTQALILKAMSQPLIAKPLSLLFPRGFLDSDNWRTAANILCKVTLGLVCSIGVDVVCGTSALDHSDNVVKYSAHFPFGTSIKDMLHFSQAVHQDSFRRYDYGSESENQAIYGRASPPVYNLANFRVPSAFLMGDEDLLADPTDVYHLITQLGPTESVFYNKVYKGFSHVTWTLGSKEAGYYVKDVMQVLGERLGESVIV